MTDWAGWPAEIEAPLMGEMGVDLGWRLIERFSRLVRESGSEAEREAAHYITGELGRLGIEHEVHEPELYLSLPRESCVVLEPSEAGPVRLAAKPPSFSGSTPAEGVRASAVHVPSAGMRDLGDIFGDRRLPDEASVRGKIVVTEGYAMPLPVRRLEEAGAVGQIYINPGKRIHWGICTPIWGTPTEAALEQIPRTPILAINRPDGDRLLAALDRGATDVTLHSALEEGWYRCVIPVARIPGDSDDFVLVHGHYDSWDVGIGDNAVGDATLLELARIFHARRDGLRRSLRIAWWPGHSTGRYAGSTWYADRFALDLDRRCVATVNIDSPGCRGATVYEEVMWMAEAEALCRSAIRDATGLEPKRRRPVRAGDYSFNQIGLTSFFMLLSNIPEERRQELGYYPVGGCGGDIAWHTEDDRLEIADRDNLERDLRVYVTALARLIDSAVIPFDYRETVNELADAVADYEAEARGRVDLTVVRDALERLASQLDRFYRAIAGSEIDATEADAVQKKLARILVPLGYARGDRFHHDPALPTPVLPRLARITEVQGCVERQPERLPFLQAELAREVSYVAARLEEATRVARIPA